MVTSRITIDQEPSDCGQNKEKRRKTFSFPFSSGSVDTDISNYPWTASILKYDGRRPKIHCGGSLISTKHILTASHCVHEEKKEDLKVSSYKGLIVGGVCSRYRTLRQFNS